jgi:serine/threonine-protein kinase
MPLDTVGDFVDALRHARLLEPEQQNALTSELRLRFQKPRALADELLRRGWLTTYQVNLLLQGHGDELLLGSYVLLDRIGEGGMGQVFKAKNWKLGRVVALKLIRKERLAKEDIVRRFEREIRAVAQLSHPNIVLAYDADEVNGTHFFAMEYVEGQDLARLIKQHGPVSVAQACDWIRQAALGLQHAYERGLVHRDIKPHNLLLTKQGGVKVLDMGLARVMAGEDGESSTTMTHEGTVMGTPDYMAPEQAEESHTVDIRADLYSLGCTLYHFLTGKAPFAGGTLVQKLKKHQFEQPLPIEERRPDVPTAVAAVVRKLMAKRPEDRYATPAELVHALETLRYEDSPALANDTQIGEGISPAEPAVDDALDFRPTGETMQAMKEEQRSQQQAERRKLLLVAAGGSVLLGGLAIAYWLLVNPSAHPQGQTQPIAAEQLRSSPKKAPSFDQWLREVADLPAEKQVEAVAAELKKRNPGFDGKVKYEIEDGAVTDLRFLGDQVIDLMPVRALAGLKRLACVGSSPKGPLTDLSPLWGMRLTFLNVNNQIALADLSPLRGMPLTMLACADTRVTDLKPLRESPLETLHCHRSPVFDLSPLRGLPLATLFCYSSKVTDLSPLKDLPLKDLRCDFKLARETAFLRSLKTLETINGKPAAEFWKEVGK